MKINPSVSLSCIQVSIVPVISVLTPDKSVPVPANAFSISSRNTITRGGSEPPRIARKNVFTFSQPPILSNVSPPRQIFKPGDCSMICLFRSQSCSASRPSFDSDIATTCSAGNAASPINASTARCKSVALRAFISAASTVSRTMRDSSSQDGKGSSSVRTSCASSSGRQPLSVVSRISVQPRLL